MGLVREGGDHGVEKTENGSAEQLVSGDCAGYDEGEDHGVLRRCLPRVRGRAAYDRVVRATSLHVGYFVRGADAG